MCEEEGGEEGEGKEGKVPVEGSGAVEELEVEGGGGLAVHFSAGAGLHGHFLFFIFFGLVGGGAGVECRVWRVLKCVLPCHCCLSEMGKMG